MHAIPQDGRLSGTVDGSAGGPTDGTGDSVCLTRKPDDSQADSRYTLGIETSGRAGSVALLDGADLLGERDLSREGRRHARTLIAEIRDLLDETGVTPRQVHLLAVSIGPGSFTGLRVGAACVKTWAYATGAAVIAVPTFDAVAHGSTAASDKLHVISDAQRGELFVGRYERINGNGWQATDDIEIIPVDVWLTALPDDAAVTGPAAAVLRDRFPPQTTVEPDESSLPHAQAVAVIGARLQQRGQSDDPWTLTPLYLRKSAAEEKAALRQ